MYGWVNKTNQKQKKQNPLNNMSACTHTSMIQFRMVTWGLTLPLQTNDRIVKHTNVKLEKGALLN